MKKLIIVLIVILSACEKQAEIQIIQENYLIGNWRQMDKSNFEWNFKADNKFERFLIQYDGEIRQTMIGRYEHKNDSIYLAFTMQNFEVINPPARMDCKVISLEKENMIWSIGDYEIIFRKL